MSNVLEVRTKAPTVDDLLDAVNYNFDLYVPSKFALLFMNFIKLVNGSEGESHATPPMHLEMLDKMVGGGEYVANLCFRGASKTTIFAEYLFLFIAVFGEIEGIGKIEGAIYVADSMENGAKSLRKNIEFRYQNSPFLQTWIEKATFTDNYLEFKSKSGSRLGVKLFGAKALALDTVLYLAKGGVTTIGSCSVGDSILGADGLPTKITAKSEIFHKPMYELTLDDGRYLQVSEDHLNQVWIKKFKSDKTFSSYTLTEATLTTLELLRQEMFVTDTNGSKRPLLWIENVKPMQFPENSSLLIDPYTVGLLLGDGSMNGKSNGNVPVVLTAHKDDWVTYSKEIPYSLGKAYTDQRNTNTVCRTILGINRFISAHGLSSHGDDKKIPDDFLFGSVAQRLALLQGLMDSDGACSLDGKSSYSSNSRVLVEGVMWLVRSLGGEARWVSTGKKTHFKTLVRTSQPMFRLERKLSHQRPIRNDKAAIVSITRIPDAPSQCIAVDNTERQFIAGAGIVRTHNTGLRGTKIFGKRPVLGILDDLVSDEDARSLTVMEAIRHTVYRGVNHALDPTRRKIVLNGTPFNKNDILVEAVESGAWNVNVYPVCERFPCEKHEFKGAWEERFSYEYVLAQYEMARDSGQLSSFYQELMLRIATVEDRVLEDHDVRWYPRNLLMQKKSEYNFYITTDFAVSSRATADFTVISVWAHNSNGDWFWVDGICKRQTMDVTVNDLFTLVQRYKPIGVGIEISGQQAGFVSWVQTEMLNRSIWFNFLSNTGSTVPGIRPIGDKLSRFSLVVPWFKAGKIYFPEELRTSTIMGILMGQLRMVTLSGIKGKDDFLDTISMLAAFTAWKPYDTSDLTQKGKLNDSGRTVWEEAFEQERDSSPLSSYIV